MWLFIERSFYTAKHIMRYRLFSGLSIFLLSNLICIPVGAQEVNEPRTVQALRLNSGESISLDGRLDETVWARALAADAFLQQDPDEGKPATEDTEVRIVFDEENLYIGAMLHDSDPSGVLGYQKGRDEGLVSDDRFMLILDTFLDGRTAYFFETNPAGLMGDGLIRAGGFYFANKSWDGIWEVQTVIDDFGWSAEIKIPFQTLNFSETGSTWGINFQRTVRRKNEETLWSGHRRNQGLWVPIHAGRLTGIQNVSQGVGLEIIPYGTAAWQDVTGAHTKTPLNGGMDLNYSVTSSLRAAFTLNTDFAETEVDQRRVNLTRFPLYFPERRNFFLESASVFQFAQANRVNPYFSRRIGLTEGEVVPIVYGARLAGQVGAYDLGFLQVRTGQLDEQPGEHFTVGRVKRNFFSQSTIGLIYTRRAASDSSDDLASPDRQTVGVDLNLSTAEFLTNKNLQFEAFYAWNSHATREGSSGISARSARGIRLNYPNDIWRMHVSYRELGDEWNPAVGFTPRRGFKRVQPAITYAPRPQWFSSIRQLRFGIFYEYLMDLDGQLLTRRADVTLLGVTYESEDRINFGRNFRFEHLTRAFEIFPGVILPGGGYSFSYWDFSASSASRRTVSARASMRKGQFWLGDRSAVELNLRVRAHQDVTVSTKWEREAVDFPQGRFTTDLFRLEGNLDINPLTSFTSNIQYDTVSQIIGFYARLKWILKPGNDFYFVYTDNRQSVHDRFVSLSRGATTKFSYTYRF